MNCETRAVKARENRARPRIPAYRGPDKMPGVWLLLCLGENDQLDVRVHIRVQIQLDVVLAQ